MGQIIIPSDKEVKGPWLIDNKGLEDLHETLLGIEKKLNDVYNILLDETAKSQLEKDKRWDKAITIGKVKQEIKNYYPFDNCDKYVLLKNEEGKKIKDKDLLSLLKDPQINEFNPTELTIYIEKGHSSFTLEISTNPYRNLRTKINVNDAVIFGDIDYEITKWIDKHRPSTLLQKWHSWFPMGALLIFTALMLATPFFLKDKASLYKSELSKQSHIILKDGLNNQDSTKALEIILQYESGYIPETFNPDVSINRTLIDIWLFVSILLAILSIRPKTVIGLGKNKWKVGFYRKWIYVVLFFIPVYIILPKILDKLF